jgi:hypothetical protein
MIESNSVEWQQSVALTEPGKWDWTPDIAVDTLGNPHIVWGEYLSSEIYYKYYNGQKWSETKNVSEDSGESYYPRIAIDHNNKVHIVWHDNTLDGDPSIYYRYLDNTEWAETVIISDTLQYSIFPRIAIDSKDNIHITWDSRQPPDDNRDVFYRRLSGNNWSRIDRLTNDTLYSINPVVILSRADLPIVLWEQVLNYYPTTIKIYWSIFGGECWTKPEAIENDSRAGCRSVAVDYGDNIHVAFNLNDSIMYTFYDGNSWSVPITITSSIIYKSHEPAAIKSDRQGNIHVSWVSYNYVWPTTSKILFYTNHGSIVNLKEKEDKKLYIDFSLRQNYPNPFNPNTIIEYSIPTVSFVTLAVFDALGKKIKMLVNSKQKRGNHSVSFDGSNLSSGCYFYQLKAGGYMITKKMLLIH